MEKYYLINQIIHHVAVVLLAGMMQNVLVHCYAIVIITKMYVRKILPRIPQICFCVSLVRSEDIASEKLISTF